MTEHSDDLIRTTTAWMDQWWDDDAALLWNPPGSYEEARAAPRTLHMVRETGWYALGLLARGDTERAQRAIAAVCSTQYQEPGTVWHGTFPRFPEERRPTGDARIWIDYDPNWRQFVGTTLALAVELYAEAIPARALDTIALAVAGEPAGRVRAWYSNIALMKAWLDAWWGARTNDSGLSAEGESFAAAVVALFDRHGAFDEYNSPTYYGIDFYALALWRSHPPTARFREWGERIEATLWNDLSRWYHAGLRNVCGPYTRAYGMDIATYVSDLSLWIWAAVGRGLAPLPRLEAGVIDHSHDLCFGPAIASLGAEVPAAAAEHLRSFTGERTVEQTLRVDPARAATGWLGDAAMVGGERNPIGLGGWRQFHPATIHWSRPDGTVGWLRLFPPGPVDAVASPRRLAVTCVVAAGDKIEIEVGPTCGPTTDFGSKDWTLPGLHLEVSVRGAITGAPVTGGPTEGSGPVTVTFAASESGVVTLELALVG
jgi:hypothetical protein